MKISKKIRQVGSKWCVFDSTGKKRLGCHDTEEEALAQLAAIESAKKHAALEKEDLNPEEKKMCEEYISKAKASGALKEDGTIAPTNHCTEYFAGLGLDEAETDRLCSLMKNQNHWFKKTEEPAKEEPKKEPEGAKMIPTEFKIEKKEDGSCAWSMSLDFFKSLDEDRLVYGVVYEPDVVDAQGDSADEAEIRKAAHRFMATSQQIGINHEQAAGTKVSIAESFIIPGSMTIGTQTVRKGAWIMVLKIHDDEIWKDIKAGNLTGLSMHGRARAHVA